MLGRLPLVEFHAHCFPSVKTGEQFVEFLLGRKSIPIEPRLPGVPGSESNSELRSIWTHWWEGLGKKL